MTAGNLYTYQAGNGTPQGHPPSSLGYSHPPGTGGYAYRPSQGSQMALQRPPTSSARPFVRGAQPYPLQSGSGQLRPPKVLPLTPPPPSTLPPSTSIPIKAPNVQLLTNLTRLFLP